MPARQPVKMHVHLIIHLRGCLGVSVRVGAVESNKGKGAGFAGALNGKLPGVSMSGRPSAWTTAWQDAYVSSHPPGRLAKSPHACNRGKDHQSEERWEVEAGRMEIGLAFQCLDE